MNISWWVQRWSELHPNKPAVIFDHQKISYRELHHRANRTSSWLQSLGIEKGDRVTVMLSNCPEFIELYLACSRLGAVFVPVNFRLEAPEIDYTLKNCRPRLFVFEEKFSTKVENVYTRNGLPLMLSAVIGRKNRGDGQIFDYLKETIKFDGKQPFLTKSLGPADPEEPHVIMYTSGTTGQPKGAVLTHRKTFFNCLNADIFFKLHFDDVMLLILPLFHSGGLFIQASPILYKGATMVIHAKFDPNIAYADIDRYRVTKFLGVPTIYKALLKVLTEKKRDLSTLQVSAIGGEKTTPELLAQCSKAGFPLRQIMGQTETSILLWASEEDLIKKPGSVGRPVFHAEVSIVDRQGRMVKVGETGEMVVRGSITMKEYWQDPERTEDTIRNGWHHTGDLAKVDEDGYFYLVDRVKDMYVSGGENIYPAEAELILKRHPDIEDVAIVGIPDDTWGEVGKAFIILCPGSKLTENDIFTYCDGKMAKFKWPKTIVFCDKFPKTSLGKVRKSKLIELDRDALKTKKSFSEFN